MKPSWVHEYARASVAQMFDELSDTMQEDIAEFNRLPESILNDRSLEAEKLPRGSIDIKEKAGPLFVSMRRTSNGVFIEHCGGDRCTLTVSWDESERRCLYKINGTEVNSLRDVSRRILLPVMFHQNLDWSAAWDRISNRK